MGRSVEIIQRGVGGAERLAFRATSDEEYSPGLNSTAKSSGWVGT